MKHRITDKNTNGPAAGRNHHTTNPANPLRAALLALLLGAALSTPAPASEKRPDGHPGDSDTIASTASSIAAANISGTLSDAQLSANVSLLNGTNVFSGTNTFNGVVKTLGGLVIENRTSDPPSPAVGQIWLRTDL
jgi:hypothetical protein